MRILVWGLGKSGKAVSELLKLKGFSVIEGDDSRGDKPEDLIGDVDEIVVSPGIPPTHKLFKLSKERNIPLTGELEVASRFFKGEIVAITGTDGKSTTTRLIYRILKRYFPEVYEGGNIGVPFSEIVKHNTEGIAVLEVSSFQAKTLRNFRPRVGVFLNFSTDHLDWHPDLKDYLESKYRLFMNQKEEDVAVLNAGLKEVADVPTRAQRILFNSEENFFDGRFVYIKGERFIDANKIKLVGRHNIDNIMASILTALCFGIPEDIIKEEIYEFEGLPFRLSFVTEYKGISIYNDSKATTVNALRSAVTSFENVVLIAGGKNKGGDFYSLREDVKKHVKKCIVIGESADEIIEAWNDIVEVVKSNDLEDAVKKAFDFAVPGDVILFSPGCASFDMFSNYIERGETFNKIVYSFISKDPLPS